MRTLLGLLFLAWPAVALAQWSMEPRTVSPGGVALVRWIGAPPAVASVSAQGEAVYLTTGPAGSWTLVGVDVESPATLLPVQAVAVDERGASTFAWLPLTIRQPPPSDIPPETLTLPTQMVTPKGPALLRRIRQERRLLGEVYAGRQPPPGWEGFSFPLTDVRSGTPFGRRRLLNGKTASLHTGLDLRAPAGTPVLAAAAGRVVLAQDLYYTGLTVVLDHGDGFFSLYAHLRQIDCRPGALLHRGTQLGEVGSTGRSTGPHLHWSLQLRGARIDPEAVLALFAGEKR